MGMISRLIRSVMLVSLVIFLSACSFVQLVSTYDDVIDAQAQRLQKKLDTHLTILQLADDDQLKFSSNRAFYTEALNDLNAMTVRASAIYENKLTVEQVRLIKINLAYLVLLNKKCVTQKLTDTQITKINVSGVDLSMDCNVEKGATLNGTERGEQKINRLLIPGIQDQFNYQLGYIMALELAKKRGEGEGSSK